MIYKHKNYGIAVMQSHQLSMRKLMYAKVDKIAIEKKKVNRYK